MKPQKWKLMSSKDVSPSKWFPIEERTYLLPNGTVVDDFTVTTLADVSMVIPITKDKHIVLINVYKPGVDAIVTQFPAGRLEKGETDFKALAQRELEEETGIHVELNQLMPLAKFAGFTTKASEFVYSFVGKDCEINSQQHLDATEEIEVIMMKPYELDDLINKDHILCAQTIAAWELAKRKFPELLS
jgi:8-oxo-dGTP pyrophosphatase MutT (NUDIX family)